MADSNVAGRKSGGDYSASAPLTTNPARSGAVGNMGNQGKSHSLSGSVGDLAVGKQEFPKMRIQRLVLATEPLQGHDRMLLFFIPVMNQYLA